MQLLGFRGDNMNGDTREVWEVNEIWAFEQRQIPDGGTLGIGRTILSLWGSVCWHFDCLLRSCDFPLKLFMLVCGGMFSLIHNSLLIAGQPASRPASDCCVPTLRDTQGMQPWRQESAADILESSMKLPWGWPNVFSFACMHYSFRSFSHQCKQFVFITHFSLERTNNKDQFDLSALIEKTEHRVPPHSSSSSCLRCVSCFYTLTLVLYYYWCLISSDFMLMERNKSYFFHMNKSTKSSHSSAAAETAEE